MFSQQLNKLLGRLCILFLPAWDSIPNHRESRRPYHVFSRLHVPHDYPNPHGIIPSTIYISEAYLAHLAENPHPHHPHLDFGLPDSMAYG